MNSGRFVGAVLKVDLDEFMGQLQQGQHQADPVAMAREGKPCRRRGVDEVIVRRSCDGWESFSQLEALE